MSVVLAWAGALAFFAAFAAVGAAIDAYSRTQSIPVNTLVWLAVAAIVAAGCGLANSWLAHWAAAVAESHMRAGVIGAVFDRGVVRTSGQHGAALDLATEAVEKTAHYRAGFVGPIIGAMSTPLIVLAAAAIFIDPAIAGWLTVLLLVVPLLIGGFQSLVKPVGNQYRESQKALTEKFLESIRALDTLAYARAADDAADRLAKQGEKHRRNIMGVLAVNQLLIFVVDAAFTLAIVVSTVALTVSRVADDTLSLGSAIALVLISTLVTGPVNVMGQFFYIGIGGRAAQHEINTYLDQAATIREDLDATHADAAPVSDAAIVFEGVSAGWPDGPDVLRDLSFRLEPGEHVALVGASGIGKSTVSALVQAHLRPRQGRVAVAGLDVSTADPADVRRRIAVVEQKAFLFMGSIRDNLLLANPEATDEDLWSALHLAGLTDDIKAMPAQLDTPVGERGLLISGGQAQRLAIARAALRDSDIVVLDEPTSQVDLASEAHIIAALARLARNRTVLMIAHRPGALLRADRVLDLAELLGVSA